MVVFLIGYMACGKSTIGRKLRERLRMPLFDTDKEIVAQEGLSIAEIFDNHGEEHFRALESQKLLELVANNTDAIVSCGGGTPTWRDNMEVMNRVGVTIYLNRSAENICSRISKFGREKRPKLRGLNDEELLAFMTSGIAERDKYYRQARLVVDCDRANDEMIVEKIVEYIKALR